jgi:hypothetical protein
VRRSERKRERANQGESTQGIEPPSTTSILPPEQSGWVRPEGISLSVARAAEVLSRFATSGRRTSTDRVLGQKPEA